MPVRPALACALAAAALAACGDNSHTGKSLTVTDPIVTAGGATQLCLGDDRDNARAGVQVNVRVAAEGFADGDMVLLVLDGTVDPQLAQRVSSGQVIFSLFTVPAGMHTLAAWSQDQGVRSDPVSIDVNVTPPPVQILSPLGGATIAGPVPATADVQIFADVEDGQIATLTLTPPSGRAKSLQSAVSGKRATIRGTFDELGAWQVRVDAKTRCGNPGFAVIDVGVGMAPPVPCVVEIIPTPRSVSGEPYPVLNFAMDPDPATAGFQATVKVHSTIGNSADLFVNLVPVGGGTKQVVDDGNGTGVATFSVDLPEDTDHVRAQCRDRSANVATSLDDVVVVDVTPPTCAVTAPKDAQILTPADDTDGNASNGTQLVINATVTGTGAPSDTQGEVATITLGAAAQTTSVAGDTASVIGTLNAPATDIPVIVASQDHAANTCTATVHVSYVTQGCTINWVSPTGVVTTDANTGVTGVQTPVSVQVATACAGKQVRLSGCDVNATSPLTATAGTSGAATFTDVTVCAQDSCPRSTRQCTAQVTNDAGITTSVTQTVTVQTVPPAISVSSFLPLGACGSAVTAQADQDANVAGTQIKVRVSGLATTLWAEDTPQGSNPPMIAVDGNGIAEVTLSDGANAIVGKGTDDSGLTGTSTPCNVTLATLALAITQPANGATLGRGDGTVSGSTLTTQVCGTVGSPSTASVRVWVDGNMAGGVNASVNPSTGAWCAGLPVPEGTGRVISALGTAGGNQGSAQVTVNVDLTAPGDPTSLTLTRTRRNTLQVGWTAPSDAARCEARSYAAQLTAQNFASATLIASVPSTTQSVTASPLKTGRSYFFGVRCFDAAGNASSVLASGTAEVLKMTASPTLTAAAVTGYTLTAAEFGAAATGADLDGDGYSDVVIGAPNACNACSNGLGQGLVYVYMGGPTGVASSPSFVIKGTQSSSMWLGASIATIDWNHDGVADIALGAPLRGGGQGAVYIFFGQKGAGSKWTPAAGLTEINDAAADVIITLDQTDTTFRGSAALGTSIAVLDYDDDGQDDLAIGAPAVDGFNGGVVLVYGPTSSTVVKDLAIPGALAAAGTTALGFTFTSAISGGGEYGQHVASLGDVSGDGRADLVVAANPPDFASDLPDDVRVFDGRAQGSMPFTLVPHTTANLVLVGPQNGGSNPNEVFGFALASIADQSGDARRELIVSDFRSNHTYMVSGALTGTQNVTSANLFDFYGEYLGASLGDPAYGLGGDVDGDNHEDMIIGFGGSFDPVSLGIWFGCDTATGACTGGTANLKDSYPGPASFTQFASTAVWVGDVNGDGLPDIVWADAHALSGAAGAGSAQVLY